MKRRSARRPCGIRTSKYAVGLSERLISLIMTNLEKDPKKRSASARAYGRELERCRAEYEEQKRLELLEEQKTDEMPLEQVLGAWAEQNASSVAQASRASYWDSESRRLISVGLAHTEEDHSAHPHPGAQAAPPPPSLPSPSVQLHIAPTRTGEPPNKPSPVRRTAGTLPMAPASQLRAEGAPALPKVQSRTVPMADAPLRIMVSPSRASSAAGVSGGKVPVRGAAAVLVGAVALFLVLAAILSLSRRTRSPDESRQPDSPTRPARPDPAAAVAAQGASLSDTVNTSAPTPKESPGTEPSATPSTSPSALPPSAKIPSASSVPAKPRPVLAPRPRPSGGPPAVNF